MIRARIERGSVAHRVAPLLLLLRILRTSVARTAHIGYRAEPSLAVVAYDWFDGRFGYAVTGCIGSAALPAAAEAVRAACR